jgi:hypothetical protein
MLRNGYNKKLINKLETRQTNRPRRATLPRSRRATRHASNPRRTPVDQVTTHPAPLGDWICSRNTSSLGLADITRILNPTHFD